MPETAPETGPTEAVEAEGASPSPAAEFSDTAQPEAAPEPSSPAAAESEPTAAPSAEVGPVSQAPRRPAPLSRPDASRERRPPQPAARNLLRETQRQVREIIESLQQALEDMESVQRLLEQVDRERREDMQELEALKRSLDVLRSHRAAPRFSAHRPYPGPGSERSGAVDEPEPAS